MTEFIVILITCPSSEEAEKITRILVSEKLIACGNMISAVNSLFYWQGEISQEKETLIVAKSVKNLFPAIVQRVKSLHSYTVPEIIALPLVEGSEEYLHWIEETLL
ncbi:MAG: divalent-cation tolerance protein CutA [Nitrospirae bacterium]|nr:divalent-cation tolerance protein CutA [Nitrospirota bacterium]MBI3594325.1 divalent-cation tolerance protein CutA [Nitrospirota bacterium]